MSTKLGCDNQSTKLLNWDCWDS